MDLVKFCAARLNEASTYASIAVLLGMAHVSVGPGFVNDATLWGGLLASCLGVIISESGKKPSVNVAEDVLKTLVAGVKPVAPIATPTNGASV